MDDIELDAATWTIEEDPRGGLCARFSDGSRGPVGWLPTA